jgi:hypothetical protein
MFATRNIVSYSIVVQRSVPASQVAELPIQQVIGPFPLVQSTVPGNGPTVLRY